MASQIDQGRTYGRLTLGRAIPLLSQSAQLRVHSEQLQRQATSRRDRLMREMRLLVENELDSLPPFQPVNAEAWQAEVTSCRGMCDWHVWLAEAWARLMERGLALGYAVNDTAETLLLMLIGETEFSRFDTYVVVAALKNHWRHGPQLRTWFNRWLWQIDHLAA